jgi:hypothetical protein
MAVQGPHSAWTPGNGGLVTIPRTRPGLVPYSAPQGRGFHRGQGVREDKEDPNLVRRRLGLALSSDEMDHSSARMPVPEDPKAISLGPGAPGGSPQAPGFPREVLPDRARDLAAEPASTTKREAVQGERAEAVWAARHPALAGLHHCRTSSPHATKRCVRSHHSAGRRQVFRRSPAPGRIRQGPNRIVRADPSRRAVHHCHLQPIGSRSIGRLRRPAAQGSRPPREAHRLGCPAPRPPRAARRLAFPAQRPLHRAHRLAFPARRPGRPTHRRRRRARLPASRAPRPRPESVSPLRPPGSHPRPRHPAA